MKRFILSISLLLLAVFTYWLFSPGIYLFRWLGISNNEWLIPASDLTLLIKNYLPDFLWAVSLINTAMLLKELKITQVFVSILFALPFISELLQLFKFIPGTFDGYDLLVYSAAYLFFFHSKIILLCRNYSSRLSAR